MARDDAIKIDDGEAEAHVYLAETETDPRLGPRGAEADTSARSKSINSTTRIISSLHLRRNRRAREGAYISKPHRKMTLPRFG